MEIQHGLNAFAAALFMIIVSACASTTITSDWKEESYRSKPDKILVVAMLDQPTLRRLMEDQLVNELKAAGTGAVAGYNVLPEGRQDKKTIRARIRELGADALLMTRLVDRKTVREYVPGTPYHPPSSYLDWYIYSGRFFSGYPYGLPPAYPPGYAPPGYYGTEGLPGYVVENVYDIAEANLYDAATGKLVWSAVTESPMDSAGRGAVKAYASAIVQSLRRQGLLP